MYNYMHIALHIGIIYSQVWIFDVYPALAVNTAHVAWFWTPSTASSKTSAHQNPMHHCIPHHTTQPTQQPSTSRHLQNFGVFWVRRSDHLGHPWSHGFYIPTVWAWPNRCRRRRLSRWRASTCSVSGRSSRAFGSERCRPQGLDLDDLKRRHRRRPEVSFWWCSTLWIITTNAKVARFFVQLSWNMPLLESGKNFCHLPKNVPLSLKTATFRENYTIFTKNCSPSAMRIVPRLCDKNRMPSMLKLFEKFWAFSIYSGSLRRFKLSK